MKHTLGSKQAAPPVCGIDTVALQNVLKKRTRWYATQREAGVSPLGVFIFDVIALGNLEGFSMDIEALADVLNLPQLTVRQQVVELIKDGWLGVYQSPTGARLHLSEKGSHIAHKLMLQHLV